jgi:hypothetical protein
MSVFSIYSRQLTTCAAILAVSGAVLCGQARLNKRDADLLEQKIVTIERRALMQGGERRAVPQQQATTVTETEVNAYLAFNGRDQIPAGVIEPRIWILGDGRLTGRAVVDLDQVRQQKERGWLDPAGYLTGRVPVEATGTLQTRDGVAQFNLESATVGGVNVPKSVLQQIISYYTATPDQPNGISLDAPFQLPAAIREIQVAKGQALVIQ